MNDQPNMWDLLTEASGVNRHIAKVSVLGTIAGRKPEPIDEELFDVWLDLIRVDPTLLRSALG